MMRSREDNEEKAAGGKKAYWPRLGKVWALMASAKGRRLHGLDEDSIRKPNRRGFFIFDGTGL